MKILATAYPDRPAFIRPGESISVIYPDKIGDQDILSYTADRPVRVDIVHVVELEPGELGLQAGLGAVFGEANR